jgi:uncharacterized protein YecT (DUF1311 family)
MKRNLGLLAMGLAVAFGSSANAAGSDCATAEAPVKRMICQDHELKRLDDAMATAYQAAQSLAESDDLLIQQRRWLESLGERCRIVTEQDVGDDSKRQCARQAITGRIASLTAMAELGQTRIFDKLPTVREACDAILSRANIRWDGRLEFFGYDSFSIPIPATVGKPAWTLLGPGIAEAKFDFQNDGRERKVFSINVEKDRYNSHLLIVADPEEEEIIFQRLQEAIESKEKFEIVIGEITYDLENRPVDQNRILPTANSSSLVGKVNKSLNSRLYDTSNTQVYAGWYTRSEVILFGGTTLLVAVSVNNLQGPTASIFKPTATGSLDLACYHRALPSRIENVEIIEQGGPPCPTTLNEVAIAWDNPNGWPRHAFISLDEWGGVRPVRARCEASGIGTCFVETDVGPVGATSVSDDDKLNWGVTETLKSEVWGLSLHLTSSGPYIAANAERDSVDYFRIQPNGRLARSCSVREMVVPPPGYGR